MQQRTNFRFWIKYTQLIARRVHELNIFCEIFPYNHFPSDLSSYKAVIRGSPFSVEEKMHRIQTYLKLGKLPMLVYVMGHNT
jgi:GMP synthase (glutamine-hydrolysing)